MLVTRVLDDLIIWVFTITGTTWTMELLYNIQNGTEAADKREGCMEDLFHYLEMSLPNMMSSFDNMLQQPHPWNCKTHLHAFYFKRQLDNIDTCPRFLCIFRNIKDTVVSFYNFHRLLKPFKYEEDFNSFFNSMYKAKKCVYGDPIDFMLSWWHYKDHPKVHIARYEDLLEEGTEAIQSMGAFLGIDIPDETAHTIKNSCSFSKMSERGLDKYMNAAKIANPGYTFFRKGVKGDWRNYLSEEQSKYIDDLVRERCHPVGLYFKE